MGDLTSLLGFERKIERGKAKERKRGRGTEGAWRKERGKGKRLVKKEERKDIDSIGMG